MSSDFAFWARGSGDPGDIFDDLAEGDAAALAGSADVLRFRAELLSRWPDLGDVLEPDEHDVAEAPEIAGKYVLLTLSVRQLDHLVDLLDLAKQNGLVGFSGVAGEPIEA